MLNSESILIDHLVNQKTFQSFDRPFGQSSFMNENIDTEETLLLSDLENVRISRTAEGFVAALTDDDGLEVVRGFGQTIAEALNDMHRNLI